MSNFSREMALTTSQPIQVLAADEIKVYDVLLEQQIASQTEVRVTLDTLAGEPWKAALCYADQCFMHNGRKKLEHAMPVGASTDFEIKIFVSPDAVVGQDKRLEMRVISDDGKQVVGVILEGTVDE